MVLFGFLQNLFGVMLTVAGASVLLMWGIDDYVNIRMGYFGGYISFLDYTVPGWWGFVMLIAGQYFTFVSDRMARQQSPIR